MKITSDKAPSEAGRRCKGCAIVIINKASVWLQHKVQRLISAVSLGEETMQSCSKKSDTPFCDSVRGRWSIPHGLLSSICTNVMAKNTFDIHMQKPCTAGL